MKFKAASFRNKRRHMAVTLLLFPPRMMSDTGTAVVVVVYETSVFCAYGDSPDNRS